MLPACCSRLASRRVLNPGEAIRYSGGMPGTRWGEAIAFYLSERGWTQRQLAERASVRPNTLTNLVKHGRDSDTATLSRIAAALKIDLAELFLTREQIAVLRAHRDNRVEHLKDAVLRELSGTVARLVREELDKPARRGQPSASRKRARRKHA